MSLTGRVHWIAGLIGGALPFVRQYILNHVYHRLNQQRGDNEQSGKNGQSANHTPPPTSSNGNMSRNEALAILGLKETASEDDIIQAHRQLMQKLHPDRGGNDYLASQLNAAKETLLKR
ncbi:DnaJ domain-containing protein [Spongiibacter sp. KMU-158]|uniref:DnaJ domain-containing protein n=2 Tax=Spongiibacter pelagi TaxID=2760804 RepID=A0A927C487_9GAMM|nr:DnaJ domain-containing protein [Spongiibacter pelagi]